MRIVLAGLVAAATTTQAFTTTTSLTLTAPRPAMALHAFDEASAAVVEEPVFAEPVFVEPKTPGLQEKLFDPLSDVFLTTLRVGTCALMIHHGFDKVQNVDGFSANVVAKFFGFLPGPASFWTLSAAGTQIVGSGLLAVGVLTRPVALSMCATMAVAVIFHLLNTGAEGFPLAVVKAHSYNFELAAMYVGVLAYFGVNGAGAYSVDEIVLGGEVNLYENILGGVFGGKSNDNDE